MDKDYTIRKDMSRNNKWLCVVKNPYLPDEYDTKVLWGGSEEIVERKVQKQLKKWYASKDKDILRAKMLRELDRLAREARTAEELNEIPF